MGPCWMVHSFPINELWTVQVKALGVHGQSTHARCCVEDPWTVQQIHPDCPGVHGRSTLASGKDPWVHGQSMHPQGCPWTVHLDMGTSVDCPSTRMSRLLGPWTVHTPQLQGLSIRALSPHRDTMVHGSMEMESPSQTAIMLKGLTDSAYNS